MVGFCLNKSAIRFFKFVRISRCILTSKSFIRDREVEREIEIKKTKRLGIFLGEEYEIEIIVKQPLARGIKERIWVENQVIEDLEEGKILFKATMVGKLSIINWLMKMQDKVEIIKPLELKVEIKRTLEEMMIVYS